MPRITTQVARQRYKRVPVLDEDGNVKRTKVNRTTRKGRDVYKKVMINDMSQPLPPRKCEKCHEELVIGEKYRSIGIKTQYGGIVRYRCIKCPTWTPDEYTNALWARIAKIQGQSIVVSQCANQDDMQEVAEELAGMIRELAEEKQEALDNMPDGLREASEHADVPSMLESWASDMEGISFPEPPDGQCQDCGGEGTVDCGECEGAEEECDNCEEGSIDCETCAGEGSVDVQEDEMDSWRDECEQEIASVLENSPV
jgi:hypothetical protein